jgi:hypothetical protein
MIYNMREDREDAIDDEMMIKRKRKKTEILRMGRRMRMSL